jgi:chromosome segregation ATPase
MKKVSVIAALASMLIAVLVFNCYARDLAAEVSALEQKVQRLQSQIDQAKLSNDSSVNQQVQGIQNSIDVLVKQRVNLDAQIARLEAQIHEIKTNGQSQLGKQVSQYSEELIKTKAQLSSVAAEKAVAQAAAASASAQGAAAPGTQPQAAPAPNAATPAPAPAQK